ncbi:NAD(+)/NADH kinase [Bdellovibrio svalbardensis]|uniref:NAD kinase n=1 Tax=Bdellovibrio svalbardensis TaxID=2972972 RepID=A0ABT6DGE7_9BACT|nr:NAD(+)/NADH kinase [Bdellovibrio svalbardensis]MDG0815574.1 NAD(+)/NADH kinase [Bdellovibrio svalbardensis]
MMKVATTTAKKMTAATEKKTAATNRLQLPEKSAIALVYRIETAKAVSLAKKVAEFLKAKGHEVFTGPDQKLVPGTKAAKTKKQLDSLKLVIVLGGDGTYLRAVRILEGRSVPIIGFNMGSLGFLTAHSADSTFDIIEEALAGKMELRPRSMIFAKVLRKGKTRGEYHALNDIVIERGSMSQLINTSIYSDKFLVSEVKADGFIVSSPSGSTAYNLAAGGPILHPESPVFVVTPVAPHSLTSRPLIVPDNSTLSFKLDGRTMKAHFIVDGMKVTELSADDEVVLTRSCYDHWMVRQADHNYFTLLREKLKFGDRS